ncbi:MAG: hypothetical protein ACYDEY_00650 [Acidimicrobiales bacterium]
MNPQLVYEWLREANPAVSVPEFETRSCILTRSLTSVATERTRDMPAVNARFPTRCWKADIDRKERTVNTSLPEYGCRAARAVLGVDFGLDCKRYARLRLLDRNVAATSAVTEAGSVSAWLSRRSVLALSPALSPKTEEGTSLSPSAARLRNRSCRGPVAVSERTIGPREHYQCPWSDLMKRWGI